MLPVFRIVRYKQWRFSSRTSSPKRRRPENESAWPPCRATLFDMKQKTLWRLAASYVRSLVVHDCTIYGTYHTYTRETFSGLVMHVKRQLCVFALCILSLAGRRPCHVFGITGGDFKYNPLDKNDNKPLSSLKSNLYP